MKRGACDGQSAYVAHKIDGAVLATLKDYLAKIKSTPKDIALEKRFSEKADLLPICCQHLLIIPMIFFIKKKLN